MLVNGLIIRTTKLIAVLLIGFCALVNAELKQNLEYKYYEFSVNEDQNLYKAAIAKSPILIDGHVFTGVTNWNIRWNYNYKVDKIKLTCYLTNHRVTLDANITLPKLVDGNQEQHTRFQKYIVRARIYQYNHFKEALSRAKNLDNILSALPPQSNCLSLKQVIDQVGYEQINLVKQANEKYIIKTNYGETEGAFLQNY